MSTDSTTSTPTANPFESGQAHEWVETGEAPSNTAVQSTDSSAGGVGAATTADQPLGYTRCPGCRGREFVSRQLVYETRTVREDGTVAVDRALHGELELVCTGCGACLRELPASQRTFYDEVGVLQRDRQQAVRQQLRSWGHRLRTWLPLV
jgi:ferredoxin